MSMLETLETYVDVEGGLAIPKEPLSKHTTFRIGGPAELYLEPNSIPVLQQVLSQCTKEEIPVQVMGNGSNLLVGDEGVPGVTVRLGQLFSTIELRENDALYCQAGAMLSQVCLFAQEHGLGGLEFAYGIPASVGGAAYMNAGAYGGEMKDVVEAVWTLDRYGIPKRWEPEELAYSYRHSALMEHKDQTIVAVQFRLTPKDPGTVLAQMEDLLARRKEKQPLDLPSAGSTFKRPEGGYAAELIERCGLKGAKVGGAMVSTKHAGFIVNTGGATCRDVEELIQKVRQTVLEQTGFRLEPEVERR